MICLLQLFWHVTVQKLIAPAMNTKMWNNPITEDNIKKAREYGFEIIEPDSGRLACGTRGNGRLREPEEILEAITAFISAPKDMCQLHVLVKCRPYKRKNRSCKIYFQMS